MEEHDCIENAWWLEAKVGKEVANRESIYCDDICPLVGNYLAKYDDGTTTYYYHNYKPKNGVIEYTLPPQRSYRYYEKLDNILIPKETELNFVDKETEFSYEI